MNHRQFFDQQAEKWDTNKKPEGGKLKRIVNAASIQKGDTVLDVGTGTGILLPYLAETTVSGANGRSGSSGQEGRVVALDLSFEMLKHAKAKHTRKNIIYVQADAEQLPFRKGKCNRVICFACFPHFTNKPAALAEIVRTLTKDGILVIAHAARREKINTMHTSIGGILSHDLIPTNAEMSNLLTQGGFSKIQIFDEVDFYLVLAVRT